MAESLREQIADLIDSCGLRQGELFEQKYTREERASRKWFDTTDIARQAELEYAEAILAAVAEDVERMPRAKGNIHGNRDERIAYWYGIEAERTNIVEQLKGRL